MNSLTTSAAWGPTQIVCPCNQMSNIPQVCPYHNAYTAAPQPTPHVCPLCSGTGNYTPPPAAGSSALPTPYTCPACHGARILWSPTP